MWKTLTMIHIIAKLMTKEMFTSEAARGVFKFNSSEYVMTVIPTGRMRQSINKFRNPRSKGSQ
jgi:hypothetical protein